MQHPWLAPTRRRLALLGLALVLLHACATTTPVATTHRPPTPKPSSAAPTATPLAPTAPPTPSLTIATAAPTPTASQAAPVALSGVVHVPLAVLADVAGIVSNNGSGVLALGSASVASSGGGLISDGGGAIASTPAGTYHLQAKALGTAAKPSGASRALLAAPSQPLLAGITVVLTDAVGVAVPRPGGGRYEAVTDASGRYAFDALPPLATNHLLVARLPAQRGALTAFVQRSPATGATIDLDLTSTLTTTYIYSQYVRPQSSPDTVLDRLPPEVEAQTRKAAAAAVASATSLPTRLGPTDVTSAVNSLRVADSALDRQLETVRRLLLLGGQADNGAGLPATDVALQDVAQLGIGPTGDLYLLVPADRRLYRIDASGKLAVVAGSGNQSEDKQDGKPAARADLGYLRQAALDAAGGLYLLDHVNALDRVSRVTLDGVLHELARQPETGAAAWTGLAPANDGSVTVLGTDAEGKPRLQSLSAAGQVSSLPAPLPAGYPRQLGSVGPTRLVAAIGSQQNYFAAYGLTWPGLALDVAPLSRDLLGPMACFDLAGGVYLFQHEVTASSGIAARPYRLDQLKPDGTRDLLLDALPADAPAGLTAATVDRQGHVLLAQGPVVLRIEGSKATRIAGGGSQTLPGVAATRQALVGPYGTSEGPDGSVYVLDDGKVLRIDPTGALTVASTQSLTRLVTGSDGLLYGLGAGRAYRVDGDTLTLLYSYPSSIDANLVAAAPNGRLVLVTAGAGPLQLVSIPATPGATATPLAALTDAAACNLAVAADGTTYLTSAPKAVFGQLTGDCHLYRIPPTGGPSTLVATDPRFGDGLTGGMAIDPQGRLFMFSRTGTTTPTLNRFDPVAGSWKAIAGPTTPLFNGTGGVDTTLQLPTGLSLAPNGDLVFVDSTARQVRRIPAKDASS